MLDLAAVSAHYTFRIIGASSSVSAFHILCGQRGETLSDILTGKGDYNLEVNVLKQCFTTKL